MTVRSYQQSFNGHTYYVVDGLLDSAAIGMVNDYAENSRFTLNGVSGSRHQHDALMRQPKCILSSMDLQNAPIFIQTLQRSLEIAGYKPEEYGLYRVYINAAFPGSPSLWHTDSSDPTDLTMVLMGTSVWDRAWFGEFVLTDADGMMQGVEYRPGRVIIFPATLEHRAIASSPLASVTRYTYAFKLGHQDSNPFECGAMPIVENYS